MFGGSGGAAEVFLVAVVVWIFLSTKSSKAAYLNLVLKMYLWLPAEALPRLRLAMGNTSHWVNLLAASDTWTTFSVYSAPGYIRLDPSSVGASDAAALACAQSWHDLFNVLLSAIASSSGGPELNTLRARLKPNLPDHVQGSSETVVEYIARLQMDYDQTCADLRAINKINEIPHPDACLVDIAFAGCRREVITHFNRAFKEANFTDVDMTWILVREYLVRAGCNVETQLLRTKRSDKHKGDPKPDSDEKDTKKDTKKDTAGAYQGTPPPADIMAMATGERIAKARETNSCTNCLGKHRVQFCPHARVDGEPWREGHQFGNPPRGVGAPAVVNPDSPAPHVPLPSAPPPGVALPGVAMSFADMNIYDEDYPLLWDNAVAFPGVRPSTT